MIGRGEGIGQTWPISVRVARTLGAGDAEIFGRVIVPLAVPHILTAIRVALGVAWATLVASELIAAQEGDYKVKPDDPGGLKVEGEGETAIATSDGAGGGNASIDLNATPETPVSGAKAAPEKPAHAGASKHGGPIPPRGGDGTTPAPEALGGSRLEGGASAGITMSACMSRSRAAAATHWA